MKISQSVEVVWFTADIITQTFIKNPVVKGKPASDKRHKATAALCGAHICLDVEKRGDAFGKRK